VPQSGMHKSGVTRRCDGVLIVGDMTVPQFLLEGRTKEDSVLTADSRRGTARLPTWSLRRTEGAVWRMLQAAARCHGRAREGPGRLPLDPEAHTGRQPHSGRPMPSPPYSALLLGTRDGRWFGGPPFHQPPPKSRGWRRCDVTYAAVARELWKMRVELLDQGGSHDTEAAGNGRLVCRYQRGLL